MHEIERTVSHSQCGPDGRMKLYAAADMMMDCCQFQECEERALRDYFLAHDLAVFLVSIQYDVLRMPRLNETVRTRVVIYDCQSIYGFRRITIKDAYGRLCMIANGVGAFFNFRERRAVRLPAEEIRTLVIDPAEDEMECLPRRIPLPDGPSTALEAVRVGASRLDVNRHLTSTEYLAIAQDRLPEDVVFDRVRIEYKMQAKLGDLLVPRLHRLPSGAAVVRMENEDGALHAVLEFSKRNAAPG